MYEGSIDLSKVNELIAKSNDFTVDDINKELQQILIVPALTTFPQNKKTEYQKKSNKATLKGYDRQCFKARKQYNQARQKYHHHKTRANFNKIIEESRRYKGKLKRVKLKEKTNLIKELRKNKGKEN